jgi:hypothetical protein
LWGWEIEGVKYASGKGGGEYKIDTAELKTLAYVCFNVLNTLSTCTPDSHMVVVPADACEWAGVLGVIMCTYCPLLLTKLWGTVFVYTMKC